MGLREEEEEFDFDTAVRLHDGEDQPKQIIGREPDGYFRTIWTEGDETLEPLQSFVDPQDCTYNPLIVPFLSDEEKKLLEDGDLVFVDDDERAEGPPSSVRQSKKS